MALKQAITTQFGVDAEYWNTNDVTISFKEGQMFVSLNGYLNEEKRQSGASAIGSKGASIVIGDADTGRAATPVPSIPIKDVRAFQTALYKALKTTPEFKDAEDV